ncbi:MAG: type II toxin-antitoxin system VapC family toxin [Acidimicrobiia bacterium]
MSTFADASAVVKLYSDESGHEQVRDLVAVAIAQITRVEVPAALWRKHRMGNLDVHDAQVLTAEFEADYYGTADEEQPRFAVAGTTVEILDEAARLCAVHGLRAHDAVQLATAVAVRAADPTCLTVAAFDAALRSAAATEGFILLPTPTGAGGGEAR